VDNPVRQPRHDIQKSTLARRKYVAEIGTIEDVLEGWEDFDPYRWSPFAWNEATQEVSSALKALTPQERWYGREMDSLPTCVVEDEPCSYREKR
jgi:hypothetical protein